MAIDWLSGYDDNRLPLCYLALRPYSVATYGKSGWGDMKKFREMFWSNPVLAADTEAISLLEKFWVDMQFGVVRVNM